MELGGQEPTPVAPERVPRAPDTPASPYPVPENSLDTEVNPLIEVLFVLAYYVMPAVAAVAVAVAVLSRRQRRLAVRVLTAALLYLVAYWSVSLPE